MAREILPLVGSRSAPIGTPPREQIQQLCQYGYGSSEGVRFGVELQRKCAELVFVPPRFEVYRAMSKQIYAIFADYTTSIQPFSLEEAYLDVTENRRGLPTGWATTKEICARIFEGTGLTASAGISYNNLRANLASDQRKLNGQFAARPR